MKKLLDKIKSIEHGFKHIVEVGNIILADKTKNHLELAKKFIADESYQVRMLGVYILGEHLPIDKAALEILETEIPKDTNWRVQEMLAKAFDSYCQKIGYEKALPTINRWINNKHENINRAIIEGLRIWTSKPYFKANPKRAIDLISKHKANKSEYVRKSVGNALRDIKRKFPMEVEAEIKTWDFTDEKIKYTYKFIEKYRPPQRHQDMKKNFYLGGINNRGIIKYKNMKNNKKELTPEQREELLSALKARFEKNKNRHKDLEWAKIQAKLDSPTSTEKRWSLHEMEITGGEPDVVDYDKKTGEYIFYDCSAESPKGRRSVCYDHEALESRKAHKPGNSAIGMAADMGIELLTEEQYRNLQQLGNFDTRTSSWVKTPANVRKLGGALFCDYRYGKVFIYHNGADSYYAARGFRGSLKV